jgi:hypothetical protein
MEGNGLRIIISIHFKIESFSMEAGGGYRTAV